MPEDSSNGLRRAPRKPAGFPPEGAAEISRGPKLPRGLLLILLLGLFLVAIVKIAADAGRQYKSISLTEFQQHWDPKKQVYTGFDKAELADDVLQVHPIKQPAKTEAAKSETPTATPAEPAKEEAKEPAKDPKDDKAEKPAETPKADTDLWYRIKVPPTALDSEFILRLATIPDFRYEPTSRLLTTLAGGVLWLALFMGAFYFLLIRPLRNQAGPGSVLAFGKSRPKLITKEHTAVKFEDVAGAEEAKEEVAEVIEFLKFPQKFARLGGRIPRGLLFVGPPGTGKTLLAKAIAGEADVPFYSISGSDFVEMFVGVGASRVRDLFRQAKESAPCIIFLDEVDAVGRRRGSGLGGGHDEREQTLNAILVEMDGFDTNEQVIVIASTNRPDVLDPALLRPGRFDREIVISLPDLKGRYEILKVHARHIKLSDKVDLTRIARGTPMFSGADLEALINEAAIRATMNNKDFVETDDLEEARDKIRFGREKRSRVVDENDRIVTAYHEAGHAMITRLCPDVEPLHKVTIIPRGMALGSTMMLPLKDRYTVTRKSLLGQIKVLYGGRIAEQIFCEDICSGASSDIERASDIARKMVSEFGMSDELGPIRYTNKEQHVFLGGEMSHPREFSEATAEQIDQAVRRIIDSCYSDARQMLEAHTEETDLLAQALLRYESLTAEEIDRILQEKNIEAIRRNGEESREKADIGNAAAEGTQPPADVGEPMSQAEAAEKSAKKEEK